MRKKVLLVFGTRPEAIKMLPLIGAFAAFPDRFQVKICVTAQHRQMLDQVLEFFEVTPDFDLNLMKQNQTLNELWASILVEMRPILEEYAPDWVFVHGDTATSTAVALAAYFARCQVGHVEAGLRTYDKWAPFPEEMNRQLTGRIADIHFAPTESARANLVSEGVAPQSIVVTGNTVIDALRLSVKKVCAPGYSNPEIEMLRTHLELERPLILVTGHRRENFGEGFVQICTALKDIAVQVPEVQILYPVHLNPHVQRPVYEILGQVSNVVLTAPLSYPAFVWAMNKSKLIITDSGGVQEEAPSLGKPVLVTRNTTERPEAVQAGTVLLVGTEREKIVEQVLLLLKDDERYQLMSRVENPYGDGQASRRIVETLLRLTDV